VYGGGEESNKLIRQGRGTGKSSSRQRFNPRWIPIAMRGYRVSSNRASRWRRVNPAGDRAGFPRIRARCRYPARVIAKEDFPGFYGS
jgi:hypothetical protein